MILIFRGFSPFFWIDWANKIAGFQFVPPLQGDLKIQRTVFFDVAGFQPGDLLGDSQVQPALSVRKAHGKMNFLHYSLKWLIRLS